MLRSILIRRPAPPFFSKPADPMPSYEKKLSRFWIPPKSPSTFCRKPWSRWRRRCQRKMPRGSATGVQLARYRNRAIAAGTHLAHYKVISMLGAGGMGEVYLAEDTRLRRKVALKMLCAGADRR